MQNKRIEKFSKLLAMDAARFVCAPLVPFFRIKRLTTDGKKYKQKIKGGAIITSNHTAFIDPFIVGITFWYRRMYLLVGEVVMGNKLRTILLKGVGAIKIDRNSIDLEAIKQSIATLKNNGVITIFPQGGINRNDEIDSLKSGAVFLALRANVPIIPMYIKPKKHWYNRQTVVIGETINPKALCEKKIPTNQDIENITNILAEAMLKCKNAIPSEE